MTTDNMTGTAHGVNILCDLAYDKGYQAALASPEVQKLVATARNLEVMLGAARSTNWLNHAYRKPLEDLTEALQPFTQKKEG